MNSMLYMWCAVSALAGFLFGFDTVVISGAEQQIQALWSLGDTMHGVVLGAALYGTVVGSLVGAWPSDRFGRRQTLIFIGWFYIISAIGCAVAQDVWVFTFARFLGGLGIGVSTVVAPLYISEIAPAAYRGRLAGMFQFNIVLGILVAFASNALIASIGGADAWRWMLGAEAVPAAIYTWLCFRVPESPRWLIGRRGDVAAGSKVLRLIDPLANAGRIETLASEIAASAKSTASLSRAFWTARLRVPILLAIFVSLFNQLSGINAILYFAPRIFELTGLGAQASLLQSIGIGVTNLVFTLVGLWLIDRVGRKTLLYVGSFGYILSLGATAAAFYTEQYGIVPICIFAFIAAHAVGQGTVIWVLISEVFPLRWRAEGQALGSFTHWIAAALLTTFFPKMVTAFMPGHVFLFFCAMMVLHLVWVIWMVPETKGIPLEAMQRKLGIEDEPDIPAQTSAVAP